MHWFRETLLCCLILLADKISVVYKLTQFTFSMSQKNKKGRVRLHCHTELVVRCQSKKNKVIQCVVFHPEYLKGYLLRLSRVTSHRSKNNGVSNFSLNTSRDTWGRLTTYPHGGIVGNVRCSHRDRMTFFGLSPCISMGASLLGSHHEPPLRTQVKWAKERNMTRARTPGLVTGRRTDLLLRTVLEHS